jgi:hypothetical protein
MRPVRTRVVAALALSLLLLGLFQGLVRAVDVDVVPDSFPEDPPPTLTE